MSYHQLPGIIVVVYQLLGMVVVYESCIRREIATIVATNNILYIIGGRE